MDTQSLDKEKMKVVKEMADMSVLVSSAKAELLKLQADKETFFTEREKETSERIDSFLKESKSILEEVISNYKQVHDFHIVLEAFSEFLSQSHNDFTDNVKDFTEKSKLWQELIFKKESEVEEIRKDLVAERDSMDREKIYFKSKSAQLEKDRKHIESQNASLQTAYNSLKTLWQQRNK